MKFDFLTFNHLENHILLLDEFTEGVFFLPLVQSTIVLTLTRMLDVQVGEAIITQYQKSPTIDKVRSFIPQTNELNIISWHAIVHALRPTIYTLR